MKTIKFTILLLIALFSIVFLSSCDGDEDNDLPYIDDEEFGLEIEGLTMANYPVVDCSTSAEPLSNIIACKLLGYSYKWEKSITGTWGISSGLPFEFILQKLRTSQTHNSFINLIDNNVDITISARKMSDDEKEYAKNAGITLIETPIVLDAFIFVTNKNNPVESLTITQIQDIYTAKTRNWKEVGGSNHNINPYARIKNSGSQELMESMVMKDVEIPKWPVDHEPGPDLISMGEVFSVLRSDVYGLGYTVYYYKEHMMRDDSIKSISINGVYPDKNSIRTKEYPLYAEVYAVIRSDINKSSMAYKLYELLQTDASRDVIEESGYVPYD